MVPLGTHEFLSFCCNDAQRKTNYKDISREINIKVPTIVKKAKYL
jgi:tRNA U38,U39,U40 pseudouridine synthase TruA